MLEKYLVIMSFIIPIIVFLFPTPYLLYRLEKYSKKSNKRIVNKNITIAEMLSYFIPFRCRYKVMQIVVGKPKAKIYKAFYVIAYIWLIGVTVSKLFLNIYPLIQIITVLASYVITIFLYIIAVMSSYKLCKSLDCPKYKWSIFFPPLCSILVAMRLDIYFKKYKDDLAGTFDGN